MPVLLVGVAVLAALSVHSVFVGVMDLSPMQIWRDPDALQLIMASRLPRTAAVLITGATVAVSGTIIQVIVRNRFVEPMTTGSGQGAALGILWASIVFPNASLLIRMSIAACTSLIASAGFLMLVQRLPQKQPLLVPLAGLIYGSLLAAVVTFIGYQFDMLQYIEIWMTGEFSGVLQGRYELLWIAAIVGGLTYLIADQLAIVGMGRDTSIGLGLNYLQIVTLGLLSISIVTALTVVTVGMIPFVGLVVPNIISRFMGDNLRTALPVVALSGAGLVLVSDIMARIVRYPFEVPVGTILGIVGGVSFLALLYSRARHAY